MEGSRFEGIVDHFFGFVRSFLQGTNHSVWREEAKRSSPA